LKLNLVNTFVLKNWSEWLVWYFKENVTVI
jgi:hypothetical protein